MEVEWFKHRQCGRRREKDGRKRMDMQAIGEGGEEGVRFIWS
jgi:hypothetical protein